MSDINKLQKFVANLFRIPVAQEEFEEQYQHDTSNVPSRIDTVQDGERPEVTLPVSDIPETEEEKQRREIEEKYAKMQRNLMLTGERTIRKSLIQSYRIRTGRQP